MLTRYISFDIDEAALQKIEFKRFFESGGVGEPAG